MKQIKAERKYIRTSPRKIRLVADLVRQMSVPEAIITLTHLRKRAATAMLKTLKQAQANAVNNHNLSKDSLLIQSIEGATYKRFRPVSRGRAHSILKRTSHIKIILKSKLAKKPKTKKPKSTKTTSKKPIKKTKNNARLRTPKKVRNLNKT